MYNFVQQKRKTFVIKGLKHTTKNNYMPRYTRREFAELCGTEPKAINVYVGRNKIILNENGEVDTALPINLAFLEKRTGKTETPAVVGTTVVETKKRVVTTPTPKEPVTQRKERAIRNKHQKTDEEIEHLNSNFEIDNSLKRLELEKKEQEVELNRLKIAKLSGDVIPTELVKVVFSQHFKSVTNAFHQGADNFITDMTKMLSLDRNQMVKLRAELIEIVNNAVADSIDESKESIKNIKEEYSQKRGPGERL